MAITEDTTAPAVVQNVNVNFRQGGAGVSTNAFTPAASTLVAVLVAHNGDFGQGTVGNTTLTSSGTQPTNPNTGGTGWYLARSDGLALANTYNFQTQVYLGYFTTSPGSITLTITGTVAGEDMTGIQIDTKCLLGAASTQTGATGGVTHPTTSTGTLQASVAAGTGNLVYGACINYISSTVPTALSNTTTINSYVPGSNSTFLSLKSNATTSGTATYGYSTTGEDGALSLVEIQAAGGGGGATVQPPVFVTQQALVRASYW